MKWARGSDAFRWALLVTAMAQSLVMLPHFALAHPAQTTDEQLTRFEHFLIEGCSPCVQESAPIAALPVPAVKITAGSRVGARTTRPGEILVEALRSHLLARPSRQSLAIRLTLSVATGNPGEMYRIASGLVDEEEVGAFASSLGEIVQASSASTPTSAGVDTVEMAFHSGSIRVGFIRLKGESTVFVQAGDMRVLARRPVWDAPGTIYLPLGDLAALQGAIAQAAAKIQKMRVGQ